MTSDPRIRVELGDYFVKKLKRLHRKYPKARSDVQAFVRLLEAGEKPGEQVQGVGYPVYKARVKNSSVERGKSGGYRIIYYLKTSEYIILLTIYAKSEQENITAEEIRQIINPDAS